MGVVRRVRRQIQVDDVRQQGRIQSTCRKFRRHNYANKSFSQCLAHFGAVHLLAAHPPVQRRRDDPPVGKLFHHNIDLPSVFHKNQKLLWNGACMQKFSHRVQRETFVRYVDDTVHDSPADFRTTLILSFRNQHVVLVGHGGSISGTKKVCNLLGIHDICRRRRTEDCLQCIAMSSSQCLHDCPGWIAVRLVFQQRINFVHHQGFQVAHIESSPLFSRFTHGEFRNTARSSHQNVWFSLPNLVQIPAKRRPANGQLCRQRRIGNKITRHSDYLTGQFTPWSHNDNLQSQIVIVVAVHTTFRRFQTPKYLLHQGYQKRQRLATAGIRTNQQVISRQNGGSRLFLDGQRTGTVHSFQIIDEDRIRHTDIFPGLFGCHLDGEGGVGIFQRLQGLCVDRCLEATKGFVRRQEYLVAVLVEEGFGGRRRVVVVAFRQSFLLLLLR
mmetsp:Transcript_18406/g.28499  ORF Transcript_18406/g.28499 Transcript_18406/m.28499 type:complete len:440 (+) Transcript_18406:298-1617(+)